MMSIVLKTQRSSIRNPNYKIRKQLYCHLSGLITSLIVMLISNYDGWNVDIRQKLIERRQYQQCMLN